MGEKGLKVGIVNMPTTYPPKKVNGFMVSGPFSSNKGFTYPPELEEQLKKEGYHPFFLASVPFREKKKVFVKEMIKSRFTFIKDKINSNQYDFLHLTIFCIDTIQHTLWNTSFLRDIWKYIDYEMGELKKLLDLKKYNLVIMSDHGFKEFKGTLYLNNWLNKKGYLRIKRSFVATILSRMGISVEKIMTVLAKVEVVSLLKKFPWLFTKTFAIQITKHIPPESERFAIENKMDWRNSEAVMLLDRGIYLKHKTTREQLKKQLDGFFRLLNKNTEKETKNFCAIRDEIYSGPYVEKAPDIILLENSYNFNEGLRADGKIVGAKSHILTP
jgi:predicted AlkP superfamily phosphohydrolase/phosphomutase